MKKLKDICLSVLISEGEDVSVEISPEQVGQVTDVGYDKKDNYIKIEFDTTFGKEMSLVTGLDSYNKWFKNNSGKFKDFVKEFLLVSEEGDESLNEIIDDNGDIMPDQDMPNNSTNSLVVGPRFDLEKIYKSFVPKSIRFYSGDLGMGSIVW